MVPDERVLFSPKEFSERYGIGLMQLERWRNGPNKGGPRFIKFGRMVKYHRDDIEAWLKEFQHAG